MSIRLLVAGAALAVVGGGLGAWFSATSYDPADFRIPEPPFLREPVVARTLEGEKVDFRAPASGVAVVVFFSTGCPTAAPFLPTLSELAKVAPAGRLFLVGVCLDRDADGEAIARYRRDHGITWAIVHDRDGRVARQFGVKVVPEAFVLDERGGLRYRGRVDGQLPSRAGHEPAAARPGLRDAVEAVLSGRPVPRPFPEPMGGPAPGPGLASGDETSPTFHRDVGPILRRSCQPCHQPGQSGPFPLTTYAQASKRAHDLAAITQQRLMPPWKPVPGVGPPLKHDRTLLPSEIETLQRWADAGAPEGPKGADPPRRDTPMGDWALGTPDLVVEMDRPFQVPADGDDLYRCFVLPTALPEDRFLTAIEVRPGNPLVVHHTFGYVDNRGLGRRRDADDPLPGYPCFSGFAGDRIFGLLGGWTPGNEAHPFGEGVGLELPRDADLVLQVHYHPSGKPETDRTRLGLHLSKTPVRQALEWVSACPRTGAFRLPPGESDIVVAAELEVPIDVALHAMTPHMHLLGKRFRADVTFPGGRVEPLIAIDDWDFNRQDTYYLREPLSLPAGSMIHIEGRYDNSSANPRNPSRPPREILWGEGTTDDMLILFLALTREGQDLTRPGARNTFMEEFFQMAPPDVESNGIRPVR